MPRGAGGTGLCPGTRCLWARFGDFHLQPAFHPLSDSNFTDPSGRLSTFIPLVKREKLKFKLGMTLSGSRCCDVAEVWALQGAVTGRLSGISGIARSSGTNFPCWSGVLQESLASQFHLHLTRVSRWRLASLRGPCRRMPHRSYARALFFWKLHPGVRCWRCSG